MWRLARSVPSSSTRATSRLLGPVDAAVDQLSLLEVRVFALVTSACGATQRPNSRPRSRNGPTPHKPFVAPAHRPGPGLFPELRRLGECKRSPCDGLAPPTPTSDQVNGVDAAGGREGAGRRRSWRRHHGRAESRRVSGAHTTASSVSAGWVAATRAPDGTALWEGILAVTLRGIHRNSRDHHPPAGLRSRARRRPGRPGGVQASQPVRTTSPTGEGR